MGNIDNSFSPLELSHEPDFTNVAANNHSPPGGGTPHYLAGDHLSGTLRWTKPNPTPSHSNWAWRREYVFYVGETEQEVIDNFNNGNPSWAWNGVTYETMAGRFYF